jgi:porphobilinogen synthase
MAYQSAPFPMSRPRRLRQSDWMRRMVSETMISPDDFIYPMFICEGSKVSDPVESMPGVNRLSIDMAVEAANHAANVGIPAIALFPYTDNSLKTPECSEAFNPDNLVNRATRAIRAAVPDIGIMLDVALDPYNSDGHDGIVRDNEIINDETLMALEKQALVQAEAGANILGPSDMMDGRIAIIRQALETHDLQNVAIMAYSAKYASAYYGPFRDAVGASGALKGDKKTYQMDPANSNEAIQMIQRDLSEGADMVMVKPGMPYLDVCQRVTSELNAPCFAYQVSGEYAMIEAAAQNGWIDRDKVIAETLLAFKRAGCAGILTYHAVHMAEMLDSPL